MNLTGYLTAGGLSVLQTMVEGTTCPVSRVAASAALSPNPAAATALTDIRQTLTLGAVSWQKGSRILPAVLTASQAESAYQLRELGLYVTNSAQQEVLFGVYQLDEPIAIDPAANLLLRFSLQLSLANGADAAVTVSPAGLVTQTDFAPVQTVVQATQAEEIAVELQADKLQAYLNALPRLLSKIHNITVSGSCAQKLEIKNFYGPGRIFLWSKSTDPCVFSGGVLVENCPNYMRIGSFTFQTKGITFINASLVSLESCTITGGTVEEDGLYALGSNVNVVSASSFTSNRTAILAGPGGRVNVCGATGSGNTYGNWVYRGGIILLSEGTPDLLGGGSNVKQGGIIANNSGTLL